MHRFKHDLSEHAYRLLFWPWLMYFSAEDAVALFRWAVMLLKALSQRIDQARIGCQTGGGHARERANRPSSRPLTRRAIFSILHLSDRIADLNVETKAQTHKEVDKCSPDRILAVQCMHIYETIAYRPTSMDSLFVGYLHCICKLIAMLLSKRFKMFTTDHDYRQMFLSGL